MSKCDSADIVDANPTTNPDAQAAYERTVIFNMINILERAQGYSDWQTLTSFIANLLLD